MINQTSFVEPVQDEESKKTIPLLLGREAIAKKVSLSVATIDRLVRDKEIPSCKVGSKRLFCPNDVCMALKNREG